MAEQNRRSILAGVVVHHAGHEIELAIVTKVGNLLAGEAETIFYSRRCRTCGESHHLRPVGYPLEEMWVDHNP